MDFNYKKAKTLVNRSEMKTAAIAHRCGIESETLNKILRGEVNPSLAVVKLLAQALAINEIMLTDKKQKGVL